MNASLIRSIPASRHAFRVWGSLGLAVMPAIGLFVSLHLRAEQVTLLAPALAVLAGSVPAHAVTACLWPAGGRRRRLLRPALSVLGLLLVLAAASGGSGLGPAGAEQGLAEQDDAGLGAAAVAAILAACWIAGAFMATIWRAGRHLFDEEAGADGLLSPGLTLFAAIVFFCGIWLAGTGVTALEGRAGMEISPLPALLAAALALAASCLGLRGASALRAAAPPASAATALAAAVAAVALAVLALRAPEVAALGPGGSGVLILLGGTMVALILLPAAPVLFGLGLLLTLVAGPFGIVLDAGSSAAQALAFALLAAILVAAQRSDPTRQMMLDDADHPPPAILSAMAEASESWLVRLDMAERTVEFPRDSGRSLGLGARSDFGDLFQGADLTGVLNLMQALQQSGDTPGQSFAVRLRVRDAAAADKGTDWREQEFQVRILERKPPVAWLALVSLRREKDLAGRAMRYEHLLSEAMVREERLLSIASHELRTPVAILSMLVEELKSGMSWEDVGASFDKTLERVVSILDDLRADSGAEGGLAAMQAFTPRRMAQQVLDVFRPAAMANGIALRVTLPQTADMAIRCDHGRVFIALSKLVHNAIVHSKGTEVGLSAFITPGPGEALTVTWQVSDNGKGIDEAFRDRIFEPFETSGDTAAERPGLGLYTARKAIRLIGGDLVLHNDGPGSRFVLTHPARADLARPVTEYESMTMNETAPPFADRSVLLVEDNKLVGEITSSRLRKLFHRVDWAEAGDAGLELFHKNSYDLVIVDQLMPGMTGSDLVSRIRKTHGTLPIVGITASTMGSECRDLEAAGVTYALEKPLSFAQMKGLAEEFFPDAAGAGEG